MHLWQLKISHKIVIHPQKARDKMWSALGTISWQKILIDYRSNSYRNIAISWDQLKPETKKQVGTKEVGEEEGQRMSYPTFFN